MNKILILLLLTVFLIGCAAQTKINVTQGGIGSPSGGQPGVTPSQPSTSSINVKVQKYARFEAQIVCDQLGGTEDVDLTALEGKAEAHAREAGFSGLEEAQAYGKSITDQTTFKQMFSIELQNLCPDAIGNAEAMGNAMANK